MISISLLLFQKLEKKLKKRNDFCYNVIIIKGDGNMDNNQLSNNNQEMNHQVTPIQEVNVEASVNNSNTFSNLELILLILILMLILIITHNNIVINHLKIIKFLPFY